MSRVSGCKMTKLEKKVLSLLTMMKLSGFMKTQTPSQLDVCSEESSAHVDCQGIKVKARANHVVVVVIDLFRTKENQKVKGNLEEHIRQIQNQKKPIIKKDKARKAKAKVSELVGVRSVRRDTHSQMNLHLHRKETENQT